MHGVVYGSCFALNNASGGSCRGLILILHLVGLVGGISSVWDQGGTALIVVVYEAVQAIVVSFYWGV